MSLTTHSDVVCPFCSLLCDDLVVEAQGAALRVAAKGCPRAAAEFARPLPGQPVPLVDGEPASLAAAVARAAEIMGEAGSPLIAGLGTDTAGLRAALKLADRIGAVVDHAHGAGLSANLAALQTTGWVTATLAEARNRPDFVLLVGTDGARVTPRLFERVLRPPRTLDSDGPPPRRIVQLGGEPSSWPGIEHIACPPEALLAGVGLLRALVGGRKVEASPALRELAQALQDARYTLIVWAVGELPLAEVVVAHLAQLTQSLNLTGRAAGLPLAGPDNVIGANQVTTWQTGVPPPVSLRSGAPDHDPVGCQRASLLGRGGADAVLWISTLSDLPPPTTPAPVVAMLRPGFMPKPPVAVLIPVGTPGLDDDGSLYRSDSVVALPVRRLRDAGLPTAADVLDVMTAAIP